MVICEIEHRALVPGNYEVGLYRVNGSDSQIKQLKDRLIKRHQAPNFAKIGDVHVLCSFVKDFLNSLTEHLITYDSWYRFGKYCEMQNELERIRALEEAILDLPEANRDTLAYMILHLQRISERGECKMPASNLARVFGPSLVGNSCAHLPPAEIINELKLQHQIVENLIKIPSSFYLSFVDTAGGSDQPHHQLQQQRLFKNVARTPDLMRKSKTAVVLSSILGPATNLPPAYPPQQPQQPQPSSATNSASKKY
jgi:Rac GTPase-activating protein 1